MSWRHLFALIACLLNALTPAAADPAEPDLAARLATAISDVGLLKATPTTAPRRFQGVVALKPDAPQEAEWTLSGADRSARVAWARLYFQQGSKAGQWQFLQLQIGLVPDANGQSTLADSTVRELTRRFGKPKTPVDGKAERLRSWSASRHRAFSIREGTFESPIDASRQPVVLLEVAVEQGEPD